MTSIPGGSLTLTEPLRSSSNTRGFSSCGTDDKEEDVGARSQTKLGKGELVGELLQEEEPSKEFYEEPTRQQHLKP